MKKFNLISLGLVIVAMVFIAASFKTYWYSAPDVTKNYRWFRFDTIKFEVDNFQKPMPDCNVRPVLRTCIAFASIAFSIGIVTLFFMLVDLISPITKKVYAYLVRFLPIGMFVFCSVSVLTMLAFPKAMRDDCVDKNEAYYSWDGVDCSNFYCSKKLIESTQYGRCGTSIGFALMIVASGVSLVATVINLFFAKYNSVSV